MGWKKGESGNAKGRPKGSKNKLSKVRRDDLADGFDEELGGAEELFLDIKEIKDPVQRVQAKLKLMEFFMPKLKAVELNANVQDQREDRTLEEIEAEIARLNAINEKEWPDFTDD